jgi:hypothetical protein
VTVCLAGLQAIPRLCPAADNDQAAVGEKLFRGALPLQGTIAGHDMALPSAVVACSNCHLAQGSKTGADALGAPDLRGGWLGEFRARRNGPLGHYVEATFCRALRTGIDPVYVTLPIQMPRFTISDQDCAALWAYLDAKP